MHKKAFQFHNAYIIHFFKVGSQPQSSKRYKALYWPNMTKFSKYKGLVIKTKTRIQKCLSAPGRGLGFEILSLLQNKWCHLLRYWTHVFPRKNVSIGFSLEKSYLCREMSAIYLKACWENSIPLSIHRMIA